MAYAVEIRDVAVEDLDQLPQNIRARLLRAIEQRLATAPSRYGVRLRQSLTGLWKLRVGDYRIVYELEEMKVTIWAIRHRKHVYPVVERRWFRA